jgi:hypothetical protein
MITVYTMHASTWNFAVHAPFAYSGFFPPVDNPPTTNVAKAGSAIPVKFALGGDQGLQVLGRGSPVTASASCDTGAALDAIEETVSATQSSLTYDPLTQQYLFVWKTKASWRGTCRTLTLKLADGTEHVALFKFR